MPASDDSVESSRARVLYAALLDTSLDAILIMDEAGRLIEFSAAAEAKFGRRRADVIGKSLADTIIPPSMRDQHRRGLARYMASGASTILGKRLELTAMRADGSEFPIELTVSVTHIDGKPIFIGSLRNISERVAATRRLESLADLASALSAARTRAEVAAVVVERGARAAGADTCTLYMLTPSGDALELIGERGAAPEVVDRIRRITATTGTPATFATLKSGESLWAEDEAEYRAMFPAIATMIATGQRAKALWSVPLIAEGRPVGLLGMGFFAPRQFSPSERSFVHTFTRHCAQALLRATRLEREDQAQRWLATTLRSIGDAVIATDIDGRVTFMNPIAESLTGFAEADARGAHLGDVFRIVSEETREVVESPVTKVLRQGAGVGLANHTVLRARDGSEIPIADSGAPIKDDDGRLLGVVLVFRDATEETRGAVRREFLAKAGEALASSSLDYRATLSTVAQLAVPQLADWCAVDLVEPGHAAPQQVAVAHVDPGKVELARRLGETYPPDPGSATGAPNVIRTGKAELYARIPAELLRAGARDDAHRAIIEELRLQSAMVVPLRGRLHTFGAITFVHAESGRHYGEDDLAFAEDFARRAALAIENARALKETEEARARERALRRDAESANRAKDEFLATVSHELRTPLNAILGWTVTLRNRKPGPELDRALMIIERNARAQARLVDDVLDASRIISGKLSLALGPTNVAAMVRAAADAVAPAAEAKHLALTIDIDDESLSIMADADRVQQMMWNLLSNAVKFTPKDGAVVVRSHLEGSDVWISVEDTGEGIGAQALPFVFDPFWQADASTTRRHGGLGLGLAIVKQLVTAHGGTIQATSPGEHRGATFTVRLPARGVTPAVASTSARAAAKMMVDGRAIGPPEAPIPRLDGLRLLVVDDEEDARALVADVLREQGAEVHAAASADEALALFDRVRPDVLVSDIGMPDVDGYSFIRQIRSRAAERGGRTPAVAVTAYARSEDAQRAFAAGYQSHVAKPVEPAQLAIVIANLGGRSL
jgi:PAS domain S-box-containing protein